CNLRQAVVACLAVSCRLSSLLGCNCCSLFCGCAFCCRSLGCRAFGCNSVGFRLGSLTGCSLLGCSLLGCYCCSLFCGRAFGGGCLGSEAFGHECLICNCRFAEGLECRRNPGCGPRGLGSRCSVFLCKYPAGCRIQFNGVACCDS